MSPSITGEKCQDLNEVLSYSILCWRLGRNSRKRNEGSAHIDDLQGCCTSFSALFMREQAFWVYFAAAFKKYSIDLLKGGFLTNPGWYTHVHVTWIFIIHLIPMFGRENRHWWGEAAPAGRFITERTSSIAQLIESINSVYENWPWAPFYTEISIRLLQAPPNRVSRFACLFSSDSLTQYVQTVPSKHRNFRWLSSTLKYLHGVPTNTAIPNATCTYL